MNSIEIPMGEEQFTVLKQRAGIPAALNSGTITQQGVTAQWEYEARPPDGGVLIVTILKKPMLVPESFIVSRFRKWAGL
jgi:hypothetical protein